MFCCGSRREMYIQKTCRSGQCKKSGLSFHHSVSNFLCALFNSKLANTHFNTGKEGDTNSRNSSRDNLTNIRILTNPTSGIIGATAFGSLGKMLEPSSKFQRRYFEPTLGRATLSGNLWISSAARSAATTINPLGFVDGIPGQILASTTKMLSVP